jgi:hypothetical protein
MTFRARPASFSRKELRPTGCGSNQVVIKGGCQSTCMPVALPPGRAKAGDEIKLDRVFSDAEDDRNRRGGRLSRQRCRSTSSRRDHGDVSANQIGRQRRQSIELSVCPARHAPGVDASISPDPAFPLRGAQTSALTGLSLAPLPTRLIAKSYNLTRTTTTPRERTAHWTRMRLSRAPFSGSDASCRMPWPDGYITNVFESEFPAYTAACRRRRAIYLPEKP